MYAHVLLVRIDARQQLRARRDATALLISILLVSLSFVRRSLFGDVQSLFLVLIVNGHLISTYQPLLFIFIL